MAYNLTQLGELTTFPDIILWVNTQVNDLLGGLFVISICIVLTFIFTKRMGLVDSLVVSSFICFVISAFGLYIGLVNFILTLGFLVMASFGVLYLYFSRN